MASTAPTTPIPTLPKPAQRQVRLKEFDMAASDKCWPRDSLDQERVAYFMDLLRADMHALGQNIISVVPNPEWAGTWIIADGRHRVEACRRLVEDEGLGGYASMDAKVYPYATDPHLVAAAAFGESALPLKDGERKRAVLRLHAEYSELGPRAIGRLLNMNPGNVHRVLKELEAPVAKATPETPAKQAETPLQQAPVAKATPATASVPTQDDGDEDSPAWSVADAVEALATGTDRLGGHGERVRLLLEVLVYEEDPDTLAHYYRMVGRSLTTAATRYENS